MDDTPIKYFYLNVETQQLFDSQDELSKSFNGDPHMLKAFTNPLSTRVLIAGGIKYFDELYAISIAIKLLGLDSNVS